MFFARHLNRDLRLLPSRPVRARLLFFLFLLTVVAWRETAVRAQQAQGPSGNAPSTPLTEEEKRRQFLKAREEMRTLPPATPANATPGPKPKPRATPVPKPTPEPPPPPTTPEPRPKPLPNLARKKRRALTKPRRSPSPPRRAPSRTSRLLRKSRLLPSHLHLRRRLSLPHP